MLKGVLGGGSLLLDERLFFIAMLKEIYLGQNFRSLMTKYIEGSNLMEMVYSFQSFPSQEKRILAFALAWFIVAS